MDESRTGVCAPAIWLNREQCCWGSRDVEFDPVHNEICEHVSAVLLPVASFFNQNFLFCFSGKVGCDVFGMESIAIECMVLPLFHVCFWSVVYATFIVVLVVGSAPYASGSGSIATPSSMH